MTTTMKTHLDAQKTRSEVVSRLLEIRALEETPELRAERTTLEQKQATVETEFRSALVAVQAEQETTVTVEDTADRELRQLTKRANLGGVFTATMAGSPTDGAEAELQKHFGLASNQVPLEMLRIDRGVEERAAATVPGSIGDASQAEVITPVFASGDGAFLGVERPSVPVGTASFPVLSNAPNVRGPFSNSADAAQTDAVYVANSLSPERLQASYSFRSSDAARFAGLDASLRLSLNGGLQEELDRQALAGTDGLLNGSNLTDHNTTSTTTFPLYLNRLLYARVDGRYARSSGDVRILVGQSAFAHMSSVYKDTSTDETAAERLSARSGGLVVSPHVPAIASKRQNILMRLGLAAGAAVQPIWNAVSILVDPFSKAVQGEVVVHATLMSNFAITRTAQFWKQQIQIP